MNDLRETARSYYDTGLNVLPANKSQKRPVLKSWKKYMTERPSSFEEVFQVGLQFDALFIVCGKTSGGLEVLDFDQCGKAYKAFEKQVSCEIHSLPRESTQSGGIHVAFRSNSCGRNTKLAVSEDGKVLIETRGEGGGVIVAPSSGYQLLNGDWIRVPTISDADRAKLFNVARTLSEKEVKKTSSSSKKTTTYCVHTNAPMTNESVADYLKRIGEGRNALLRAGWSYLRTEGDYEHWRRPQQEIGDKTGGSWSISEGYFHVFTTNAPPLEVDRTYSNLQLVAALEFDGDEAKCSKHYIKLRPRPLVTSNVINTLSASIDISPPPILNTVPITNAKKTNKLIFPKRLYEVGGTIGELANIANKFAIRPQPEGAFLGALSCMSFLAGRTLALNFNGILTTPNIYALFLAPSGMGKEIIRRIGIEVARTYFPNESVPETFASVQALQNMMIRRRKIFWLHDEFGRDLAVMNGKTCNSNLQGVITESLKLYSNANNRAYLPKIVAQEAKGVKQPESVDRPSLTIFATGNPREFYDATNESVLRNGYVARFTTISGREYSEKRPTTFEQASHADVMTLAPDLRSRIKAWKDFETTAESCPYLASFNRDAFDCIQEFDKRLEAKIKDSINVGGMITEFSARLSEKIWKYALLFTASTYGARRDLCVDSRSAELAVDLAEYELQFFEINKEHFANTEQSKLVFDILDWARAIDKNFTKSEFTRKFQRRGTLRERNEALITLVEGAYLLQDEETKTFYVNNDV